jgi:hypothetical protein
MDQDRMQYDTHAVYQVLVVHGPATQERPKGLPPQSVGVTAHHLCPRPAHLRDGNGRGNNKERRTKNDERNEKSARGD